MEGIHFTNLSDGDVISAGETGPITGLSYAGTTLTFTEGGVTYHLSVTTVGAANFTVGTLNGDQVVVDGTVVCFAAGTLIRTPGGDVPVETLKVGDLVLTASGGTRPVKWMGHTEFDFRRTPGDRPSDPGRRRRVRPGPAFPGPLPSPGHRVCVDLLGEVFIPVGLSSTAARSPRSKPTDHFLACRARQPRHPPRQQPAGGKLSAMANRGAFEELRGLLPAKVEGREGRTPISAGRWSPKARSSILSASACSRGRRDRLEPVTRRRPASGSTAESFVRASKAAWRRSFSARREGRAAGVEHVLAEGAQLVRSAHWA